MQVKVRGFLVRGKIYPKELEEYLLVAMSDMNLIVPNVIYREVSGIVLKSIKLGHIDQNEGEKPDSSMSIYIMRSLNE
jgi:hypothetical protein